MDSSTLQQMMVDPSAFRERVLIERADGSVAKFGSVMLPVQDRCFRALDGAWLRVSDPNQPLPPVRKLWAERLRGGSKTSDVAISATWGLLFSRRPISIVCVACDADQAALVRVAIERLVRLNKFDKILRVDRWKVTNLKSGSSLEILSSDAASAFGLNADAVIIDEVAQWPSDKLWVAIVSGLAKRPHAVCIVLTNAGHKSSWVWPVREAVRCDDGWAFDCEHSAPPWISEAALAEQRRLLPAAAYRRLWEGIWSDGQGDAIDEAALERSLTLSGPAEGREPFWRYCLGVDLGLRRDHSAVVVVGRHVGGTRRVLDSGEEKNLSRMGRILEDLGPSLFQPLAGEDRDWQPFGRKPVIQVREEQSVAATNRVKLCATQAWRPDGREIDLEQVEKAILDLHDRFHLSGVFFDPWQGAYLSQRLTKRGLRCEPIEPTGGNLNTMASELFAVLSEGRLDLYEEPRLLADLRSATVEERQWGGMRISFPRTKEGGHGDVGTAFLLALHGARKLSRTRTPTISGKRLVY